MLKNLVPCEWKTLVAYHLIYDDGHGSGYSFPCDEQENLSKALTDAALLNLEFCKEHPEQFVRAGEVVRMEREYLEPAHGACECGNVVTLINQYFGACQCPKCGRWYNLFGESLLPPEQWEGFPETN